MYWNDPHKDIKIIKYTTLKKWKIYIKLYIQLGRLLQRQHLPPPQVQKVIVQLQLKQLEDQFSLKHYYHFPRKIRRRFLVDFCLELVVFILVSKSNSIAKYFIQSQMNNCSNKYKGCSKNIVSSKISIFDIAIKVRQNKRYDTWLIIFPINNLMMCWYWQLQNKQCKLFVLKRYINRESPSL